jgi:hypothetical protein
MEHGDCLLNVFTAFIAGMLIVHVCRSGRDRNDGRDE